MKRLFQIYYTTQDEYFASFHYFIDRSNDRDFWGEETFAEFICRSNLWGFDKLLKEIING
jgi:hypothetical protein